VERLVYLALGSNLGDRAHFIGEALRLLEGPSLAVLRRSSFYETEPRDFLAQPWFLNMVVEARTRLFPKQLLARTQSVERRLGRQRNVDKGPRTVDIDILLYGDSMLDLPELTIPHPRMCERRFVLEPLAELRPDFRHPASRETMKELVGAVSAQNVIRLTHLPAGRSAE
jgi:2-amino-4-hydroxy-6-hydroxymethyldihydropteridine diphosphokinase